MGVGQFDERYAYATAVSILPANTTANVGLASLNQAPTHIDQILVISTDTVDRIVDLKMQIGGTVKIIGSATIPALTGTGGAKSMDFLAACLPATMAGLTLPLNCNLDVAAEVTITTAKTIDFTLLGGFV